MRVVTRMGDGTLIEMSEAELRQDLEDGTQDAAERGEIATLSGDELAHLLDIFRSCAYFFSDKALLSRFLYHFLFYLDELIVYDPIAHFLLGDTNRILRFGLYPRFGPLQ